MVGCRGDAYNPAEAFSTEESDQFHTRQVEALASSGVDFIKAARRVLGFQANTSAKSPEELDNLPYLDTTEPDAFAEMMLEIHKKFGTRILGGCCGTDNSHIEKIADQLVGLQPE